MGVWHVLCGIQCVAYGVWQLMYGIWCGIWCMKKCFAKVICRYTPSHSEFITVLSDVQKVLNNRPLTYRSQANEVDIITPNHILVGRPIPSLLFGDLN